MADHVLDDTTTNYVLQRLRDYPGCPNASLDQLDAIADPAEVAFAKRVIDAGAEALRAATPEPDVDHVVGWLRSLLAIHGDSAEYGVAQDVIAVGARALRARVRSGLTTAQEAECARLDALETTQFGGAGNVINRLLATAPKFEPGPGFPVDMVPQAPAMQCQIRLNSGFEASGVLSVTPEGTLRFLMPVALPASGASGAHPGKAGRPALAEVFFGYEDVEAIVLVHEIKPQTSPSGIILSRA